MINLARVIKLCAVLLLLAACNDKEAAVASDELESPALINVTTITLQRQSLQPTLNLIGIVQSSNRIDLTADVAAPVAKVLVKEGQRVRKGQLLIELDSEKLQIEVTRAAEALKQARSRLQESYTGLQRREQLAKQQTLSAELLDSARHDHSRSQAAVEEARAALRLAERGLRDAKVLSPVAAVVDKQHVEVGENVRPGDQLLVIQATSALEVAAYVSERDIGVLSEGNLATVHIDGWQPRRYSAVLHTRGAAANPRTGNFLVTLLIDHIDQHVRPGMTAQLAVKANPIDDVLLLPEAALADRQRQRVVFVEDNGRAVMRRPRLQTGFSDRLLILSGLQAGERVIIDPLDSIVDGVGVHVDDQ